MYQNAIPSVLTQRHFFGGSRPKIYNKLKKEIRALNGLKFQLQKTGPDGTEEYTGPVLCHKQKALLQPKEIDEALDKAIPNILETLEKWAQRGSWWIVNQVETLWLDIARYQPLRGSSYIPLPAVVRNKMAVIYVKNKDDHCFHWALRSALSSATTMWTDLASILPRTASTLKRLMPPRQFPMSQELRAE